jgi:hypothetical protein
MSYNLLAAIISPSTVSITGIIDWDNAILAPSSWRTARPSDYGHVPPSAVLTPTTTRRRMRYSHL